MSRSRLVEPGTVLFRIRPNSCPFFTGLAPSYSERYSKDALEKYITQDEFGAIVRAINGTLFEYWPCPLCFYGFGVVLGILTLGLCCLCPYLCVRDARSKLMDHLVSLNRSTPFFTQVL
ncbi:unnamed protein product [Moneuplotes crassus]|uniref:Golgin subfamily A member 7/ERF4 domain-containing protein n=1 Tax=Euplotes crassus TaxID=5936 RepID=A0AAD1Y0R4_EUPCR|nr:unnamed protein product [Moneuplotes crassus]